MPVASILAQQKQIRTIPYSSVNKSSLMDFKYKSVSSMDLASPSFLPRHYSAYIWAKYLRVSKLPSWKGFMEVISREMDHCTSHIICLPFINEAPSNLTTLNTSLHYALQESLKQKQGTCFVTYDQPLYLKARSIVLQSSEANFDKIVVRLGGFHLLMSYLGAIGHIMAGSGLDDLWSIIYAQQSTKKMMSGHAYSRSVRAHILTFTALGIFVCEGINSKKEQAKEENEEGRKKFENYTLWTNNMKLTFSNWQDNPPLLQQFETDDNISILTDEFTAYLDQISKGNPTAQLWVQYIESVSVALQFIEAERLGNWQLHLQSVKKMLPLFHASGHFAYAKSAQMYLQDMVDLEFKMDPVEYDRYTTEGFFTIRRSDKAWSGVWSDMTIEQTLNRFFGTDLKHGRGVTPSVVARYLLGMPAACNIMENLENYINLKTANSEQHTDLSRSKIDIDEAHIASLLEWLRQHNPFAPCMTLISLSTGIIGNNDINCHKAYEVGEKGMATMVGKTPQLSLSKLYKVRNLLQAKSLHVEDTCITINPLMLFQRIHVAIQQDEKKLREAFQYELSPYPLALFDDQGFMRKTAKAQLYKLFDEYDRKEIYVKDSPVVIDGGWLLHHVVWPHSRTFGEIFEVYYSFLRIHYGKNVTVVFDGYYNDVIGVKSYERYRRKEKNMGADICIVEENESTLTQTKFLSNTGNKVKLVEKLLTYLRQKGVRAEVAAEDADSLIVNVAVQLSQSTNEVITIVGNDVDLLILLVALAPETHRYHFFKVAGNSKSKDVLYSVRDQKAIKSIILFAHAFAGCDSTSALYKKGKTKIVNLLKSDKELKKQIKIFYNENESIENLFPVAEKIIYSLYHNKRKKSTDMESLRYECYKTAVTSSNTEVLLATLPPTKSALMEHVKRVYYQIQLWLGRSLNAEQWGWKRTQMMLIPVSNPEKPAPESLLKLIHCSCTGNCATRQCSCRKSGLECNNLCKQCNGESCSNRKTINMNRIGEDSEDEDDPESTNDIEVGENKDNNEPEDDREVEEDEDEDENIDNITDEETEDKEMDDDSEGVRSDESMDVDSNNSST